MTNHYRIVGGLGSPYTMKLRAVMRYRRLPHVFEMRNGGVREEVAHVRPPIIPMLQLPGNAHWRVDSTPIIHELEALHAERSVLPDDPAQRFLAELVEDFGDEWLTKAMFHYRWFYATDCDYSSGWIAADQVTDQPNARAARREFAAQIAERQVSRMPIVGCTARNRPVIERTYERVLDALEGHVGFGRYLFGTRPSIGDFGLFGQLKTLGDDTSPQWLMRHRAPTVSHWVRQMDDLSGIDGAWDDPSAPLPAALTGLLAVIGEAYLPFLAANAAALADGADTVALDIWGHAYAQPAFRYQGKCYSRLRSLYAQLDGAARERAEAVLEQTGCLRWLD